MSSSDSPQPSEQDRLRRLAAWLPGLEAGLDFGRWTGGEKRPDGSITMPYYAFSPVAMDLLRDLPVIVFDWPAWMETDEARGLLADYSRVDGATREQLFRLTTALVRGDRFGEGTLAWAFESGLLLAIVRRAAALAGAPCIGERGS
jgi:hypothetical protein